MVPQTNDRIAIQPLDHAVAAALVDRDLTAAISLAAHLLFHWYKYV